MEKELIDMAISKEVEAKVEFKNGQLRAEVAYVGKQADAGMFIALKADAVLDALAEAIPGHFDDLVIAEAKALLAAK